jgi:hypothetical protein
MKQTEEDDQQQQLLYQRFEQSRLSRAKVEAQCLLGFITPTPKPGAVEPAADPTKEQ